MREKERERRQTKNRERWRDGERERERAENQSTKQQGQREKLYGRLHAWIKRRDRQTDRLKEERKVGWLEARGFFTIDLCESIKSLHSMSFLPCSPTSEKAFYLGQPRMDLCGLASLSNGVCCAKRA